MVLRAADRVGQAVEAELGEPGEELLEGLGPEAPEDECRGLFLAPSRDQAEDQAGQEGLVEDRDGPVAGGQRSVDERRLHQLA